jgi:hypothetical protein
MSCEGAIGSEHYLDITTNASNSFADNCTEIGVVASFGAIVLILQRPQVKHVDARWGITLRHILQEVRAICKTRNQLNPIIRVKSIRCYI